MYKLRWMKIHMDTSDICRKLLEPRTETIMLKLVQSGLIGVTLQKQIV